MYVRKIHRIYPQYYIQYVKYKHQSYSMSNMSYRVFFYVEIWHGSIILTANGFPLINTQNKLYTYPIFLMNN